MNKETITLIATSLASLASAMIGKVTDIGAIFWTGLCVLLLIITICLTVYVIKNFFLPKGVFAVSAIIVNEKMELLLYKDKRDGTYKQPGGHYVTNKLKRNNELEKPYSKIFNHIKEDTGIDESYFEFIDLSKYQYKDEITLGKIINEETEYQDVQGNFMGYEENVIIPPPFFIMQEKSKPKIDMSGVKYYIDMFYTFKIKANEDEYKRLLNDNAKFYSTSEINKLINNNEKVYPDLIFVYDKFKKAYSTTHYPKSNIRFCTFDTYKNKNILLWRITEKCNAKCDYCFLKSGTLSTLVKSAKSNAPEINDSIVKTVIEKITENKIQKVIISGGEPLLVKNLVDIIKKIAAKATCESITICTNGIKLKDHNFYRKILELKNIKKFKKFVISIDHHNEDSYKSIKKHEEDFRLSDLIEVINKLKKDKFKVFINVVATDDFLADPDGYVEYWRNNNIKNLSISYPIKCDNQRKFELKSIYDRIISGDFGDVSFLDENGLELIIPDCEYKYCPHSDNKIFHVDSSGDFSEGCIEK
jgi:organic radical activating enzyme